MENTSKALLIAAAVLIAILLIVFAIKILKPATDVEDATKTLGENLDSSKQSATKSLALEINRSSGVGTEDISGQTEAGSQESQTLDQGDEAEEKKLVANVKNKFLNANDNTEVFDEYGNKIVVPAGFCIKTDSGQHVTEGIVICDSRSNEFVWIPVGTVYKNVEQTQSETITLGRYDFDASGNPSAYSSSSTEDTKASHDSAKGNAIAKDIEGFIESAKTNGGYYIGRYEARTKTPRNSAKDKLTPVTSMSNDYVYNYITQPQASEKCQEMYTSSKFTSDLMNSYAWDTAIVFIQVFSGDTDYSRQTSLNTSFAETGTRGLLVSKQDKILNIWDMASNCFEWTTQNGFLSDYYYCCMSVGGGYYSGNHYTSLRSSSTATAGYRHYSFRPILYI